MVAIDNTLPLNFNWRFNNCITTNYKTLVTLSTELAQKANSFQLGILPKNFLYSSLSGTSLERKTFCFSLFEVVLLQQKSDDSDVVKNYFKYQVNESHLQRAEKINKKFRFNFFLASSSTSMLWLSKSLAKAPVESLETFCISDEIHSSFFESIEKHFFARPFRPDFLRSTQINISHSIYLRICTYNIAAVL